MFSMFFIFFLLIKLDYAQENGQFWWLNNKFANYVGSQPPPPMFEKLSEMDNDESAKIIFRDNSFFKENSNTVKNTDLKKNYNIKLRDDVGNHNIIRWPDEEVNASNISHNSTVSDQFVFQFPVHNNAHKNPSSLVPATKNNNFHKNASNDTVFYNDKVKFALYYKEKLSENICTYIKKSECYQNKGALNVDMKDEKKYTLNRQLICCILPVKAKNENELQKISFSESTKPLRRLKRSRNTVQGQRNILLSHNYRNKNKKAKHAIHPSDEDDEYEDPYVNIKNNRNHRNRKQEPIKNPNSNDDYQEDYAVEIPAPGLTGLYSDVSENKYHFPERSPDIPPLSYDDDDNNDFGYTTVDPGIGKSKKRKSRPHSKPLKLTTTSEEIYDVESQTISFQSDPSFNVLQAFKLPNLTRKKVLKTRRSTTTESFANSDIEDVTNKEEYEKKILHSNNECEDRQIFKGCGITSNPISLEKKQIGDTVKGSHPWLAILVPTHKENKLLCYASLIHPRAAVTAGDCVHKTAPGEITLLAALWDLSERSRSGKRVVTPLLHPQYKSGEMNKNLALVHWKKPLKLGVNVQPVCLAYPQFSRECMFVGWGGFDQPIRTISRWQRATIHECKDHTSLVDIEVPNEAFCASVKSRSTVTGIGGSLICRVDGHLSAVGVAVSRDSTLILLPISDWITSPNIGTFIGFPE